MSERSRKTTTQKLMDWDRYSRLSIIERCQLTGVPARSRIRLKTLLRVLESHCRTNNSCCLSAETIGVEMGGCLRTAFRSIAQAESEGLISVDRVSHRASCYQLNWTRLLDLCSESMTEEKWLQLLAAWDQQQAGIEHNRSHDRSGVESKGGMTISPKGVTVSHSGVTVSHSGVTYSPSRGDISASKSPLKLLIETPLSVGVDLDSRTKAEPQPPCRICNGSGREGDRCEACTPELRANGIRRGLSKSESLAALKSWRPS